MFRGCVGSRGVGWYYVILVLVVLELKGGCVSFGKLCCISGCIGLG